MHACCAQSLVRGSCDFNCELQVLPAKLASACRDSSTHLSAEGVPKVLLVGRKLE